ncbi:hypothetical protein FB565_000507 [Actinoplanes lutulentus]|uniref:Uncharacterized protein n=1 Tax=Actinoplanes lutulentus TaxID=1287878 RepID=A0A327ZKC4_9ACTN|nr:hypothetical protein [Actinoplanes lutulentus]MBB2940803.1 hypothetical protein [Actinoplanes lutulentus]RAK43113.1 hypothetical protein B0I29_101243 [Actinoplanes lutulentus]
MRRSARQAADDITAIWGDAVDISVTPMIGVNDSGAVTTLADAESLLTHAKTEGYESVRFWSADRDTGDCPDGTLSSTCSGIAQDDHAFAKLFTTFND